MLFAAGEKETVHAGGDEGLESYDVRIEEIIMLPPLVSAAPKGEDAEKPRVGKFLKALPRVFLSAEELQDPPLLPTDGSDHEFLGHAACGCAVLAVLIVLGSIACLVMLIFNEVVPYSCPAHHVECRRVDFSADPHFRTTVLLIFLACCVLLPFSIASCQSHCICLLVFLREDGLWSRLRRSIKHMVQRCAAAPAEIKRLCCHCCRRTKNRVEPWQRHSGEQRCFGVDQDFNNLMIPMPTTIPRKPVAPATGFPRRWCHTALPHFHEVVELSVDGEGGDIARLVLNDPTWHCPPRCERVFRIESSSAWAMYTARRSAILRGRRHSDEFPRVLPNLGEELDPRANEQILLYGTTVEMAELTQLNAQVPDTPDCPRHVLLRRFGGGAQFCDRGFLAHEQATEAGYNKENLDSPWAVLVCRVLLGRSLIHNGQHAGPRLHREWGSGMYSSITIRWSPSLSGWRT
ncbi:DNA mismatch repair protein MSH6 [Durusdinium trenchii]|uniref:DNA mismatch repair protein MSH6 n=1 Tax=Durusdinium trenchii TaxID=1381693 RepID=A0ABP0LEX0_9DINO